MQSSKVVTILMGGMFIVSAVDAGSISVRQTTNFTASFHVQYEQAGKNESKFSADFSSGENRTIEFPDEAVNIQLDVYSPRPRARVFTKSYDVSVRKCFTLFPRHTPSAPIGWDENPYTKWPAADGPSISVTNDGWYLSLEGVLFTVMYEYEGSNVSETSHKFSNGETRTILIPDEARNINVQVFKPMFSKNFMQFTKSYILPVKKCFEVYRHNGIESLSFEKPCQPLPAEGGYFVSVFETRRPAILFINYEYNGLNLTESSGDFLTRKNLTLRIPDEARNITVRVHSSFFGEEKLLTKFYVLPVAKCFEVYMSDIYFLAQIMFEKPCRQLPAVDENSISVHRTTAKHVDILLLIDYDYNGSHVTTSSGEILAGENKTVPIPDEATNIIATLYETGPQGMIIIFTTNAKYAHFSSYLYKMFRGISF